MTDRYNKVNGRFKPTRLYQIWLDMRYRCSRKKDTDYHNYGARGITVCDEWQDFVQFRLWALNLGYEKNLTIDRIDNDGNYEPSNCRWANRKTQALNSRASRLITYDGETHGICDWAKICGVSHSTIARRLAAWSVKRALTTRRTKAVK